MEKNILLTIEYDGSEFSGWQRQPECRTVQGVLEQALSQVTGHPIWLNGTSRTDAGVHALGQRASFCGEWGIPTEKIPLAVNHRIAGHGGGIGKIGRVGDVRILSAEEKPLDFHARFNARGKLYRYMIRNGEAADIFLRKYRYQICEPLDVAAMEKAGKFIEGTHDFLCFQASGSAPRQTTVRTIHRLNIFRHQQDVIIEVAGDGFLYNMVRIIAGTLVEVGLGRRRPEELERIIESRDRRRAGHTAPPEGLYLVEVFYD